MSNTFCNIIKKGLFVSHRGVSLCCINPDKHKIKPSEFWKSQIRQEAVRKMSMKEKVKGCDICYVTEEKNTPSSRMFYNSYKDIPSKISPTMLDLDFSNFCNLKCVMCNSSRSSEWAKDQGNGISSIHKDLIDDLITISNDVEQMTIQGGEPSIMEEYVYYFDCLDRKALLKNINLQIITNATNLNNKFYRLLEKFKSVRLSVSIDAYGYANDYIRWPSHFKQIEKNLIKMSDLKNTVRVEILNSLNILSMFNFKEFLEWCKKIEKIYEEKNKYFGVVPMKVTYPIKFSPFVAPINLKERFIYHVKEFLKTQNLKHNNNFKTEILMIVQRLRKSNTDQNAIGELKETVKNLDLHRKSNVQEYIPEFYHFL